MRSLLLATGTAASLALLSSCGGSQPPAGHPQAAAACQTSGAQAATLADQAASLNPAYSSLALDEHSLLAGEATQTGELSDGNSTDDSGLGALAGANSVGNSADIKVLGDCVSLGLSVTQH